MDVRSTWNSFKNFLFFLLERQKKQKSTPRFTTHPSVLLFLSIFLLLVERASLCFSFFLSFSLSFFRVFFLRFQRRVPRPMKRDLFANKPSDTDLHLKPGVPVAIVVVVVVVVVAVVVV